MNQFQRDQLSKIKDMIEEVQSEEQEKYDNVPENLQYSEKYDLMQEGIDLLEEVMDGIDSVMGL